MKIITSEDVRKWLTPGQCVALMRQTLIDLESGRNSQPPRQLCKMPNTATFGFMPASIGQDYFGAKVIAAYAPNIGTAYPSHIGYVLLYEAQHCTVVALVEAGSITEIRTGAVSAVATDLLAKKDARSLALIGAGAQARSHTSAIRTVRDVQSITVYDIRRDTAKRLKKDLEAETAIPVTVCASAAEAVRDADIICTLTPSQEPFLTRSMVRPGTHINAVGTFTPTTREVASDLMAVVRLYADQVAAMKRESGQYRIPLAEGLITQDHIIGSIGQVLLGEVPGRISDRDITLFDALGLAVEDVASACFVYEASQA